MSNSAFKQTGKEAVTIETTSGTTHSLTTLANQKVVVIVKGWLGPVTSNTTHTLTLKYNTVTKDTVQICESSNLGRIPFCMQYTETPGAATQNITVETSGPILNDVVIIVMKF